MLSFEQLREIHRTERSKPIVQSLSAGFWKEVADYIFRKMKKYEELRKNTSRFTDKVLAKFERELRNAARVIVELYALRERKIILLAWSEVATDEKTDVRALTIEEKDFFTKMVSVMKGTRSEVLDRALAGEEAKLPTKSEETLETDLKVEIVEDVQSFMGTDLNLYGPYSPGDVVQLPKKYAKLLLEKGKAKQHKA